MTCGDCIHYRPGNSREGTCWAFVINDPRYGPITAAAFASEPDAEDCDLFTPRAPRGGEGEPTP